jgi:hypothetical protein
MRTGLLFIKSIMHHKDSGRSLEENIKNLESAMGLFKCYGHFCQKHGFSFGCSCSC